MAPPLLPTPAARPDHAYPVHPSSTALVVLTDPRLARDVTFSRAPGPRQDGSELDDPRKMVPGMGAR